MIKTLAALVGVGLLLHSSGAQEPEVLTATARVGDAPEVQPRSHGLMRQNVWIDWTLMGPGPVEGEEVAYFFTSEVRAESIDGETPVFSHMNLADGRITSYYAGTPIKVREAKPALDLDAALTKPDALSTGETPAADMTTSWVWGRAISGTPASKKAVYLGTDATESAKPMLLRFLPRDKMFEELSTLASPAVGMTVQDGTLWYLTRDGGLYTYDDMGGAEFKGKLPAALGPFNGLVKDTAGRFYTRTDQYPFRVFLIERSPGVKVKPLLADKTFEKIVFHENRPAPWLETVVKEPGGHFREARFQIKDGQAVPVEGKPDESALAAERGYEIALEADAEPLVLGVRKGAGEWKRFPIVFDRTGRDKIRALCPGADGRYLYGGGWPVAWIWRFDPETDTFKILGRHYEFYEMHPWKDEMWVDGYWGIKLLRWRTGEPWTFDYPRHYEHKTYPGNTSPWGDKDISNPRLVCKFRYLKQLNVRRPAGMAFGSDGRVYIGCRTPAVEYYDSRYGGALNWYDPATETIGQIREPFLHHSIRDVCNAGDRYIAAAGADYICMFEPIPTNFSRGKFVLYDTQEHKVALDVSPLDAPLSYCEEGEPGRVVVSGSPGKYAGEGIRSVMFIFDVKTMAVTHVIRLPVKVAWGEYNVMSFVRGPDRKIYFYGADDTGTALFQIDSLTGKVEPVLRAKGITDKGVYLTPGAHFAFMKDRVYFGTSELLSVPVETVTGAK